MNTQSGRIAGFMSAESIYSLAFYIVMVAAIAGVGASVLENKDAAKAASAVSLLRANFIAESAGLGYNPPADAAAIARLSGNLMTLDNPVTVATLPGGAGVVTIVLRTAVPSPSGFSINIVGVQKPAICNAVAGVGYGTWTGHSAVAGTAGGTAGVLPASGAAVTLDTKNTIKTACATASADRPTSVIFVSD